MPRLQPIILIVLTLLASGCVAVRAPLEHDDTYPTAWPRIAPPADQCRGLTGTYSSLGTLALGDRSEVPVSLFDVLHLNAASTSASLEVVTQRLDKNGDAFSTLVVIPVADRASRHELKNCYCVKRTLVCTQLGETYWSVPTLGFGGKQSNVYVGTAHDGSLIVKLQNYRIDVVLGVPLFKDVEPWARFAPVPP